MIATTPERLIYFNEKAHTYTDNCANKYTSMTTVIGKYEHKSDFKAVARACEKIGRNPNHPKYSRYKGKTAREIELAWTIIKDTALENGTKKHDFLEHAIKNSNGYKKIEGEFINDRIYTILDIINASSFGTVDLEYFRKSGIDTRYPIIYNTLKVAVDQGWKIYSEVGVYSTEFLISGLIDLFLYRNGEFIIIDWKTNRADIRFDSGYFYKDDDGELTTNFISKRDTMNYPLTYLADSVGNHYALQLSGYTYMAEAFGLKNKGNILFQIREDKDGKIEKVDVITMPDLREDVAAMFKDHLTKTKEKNQMKMFI